MTFGELVRKLREDRHMTLRRLGEEAGLDYVILNKVELGLRIPPPLEVIITLVDALNKVKAVSDREIEQLLELAAQPNKKAGPRFSQDALRRLRESQVAPQFFAFTRRERSRRERE